MTKQVTKYSLEQHWPLFYWPNSYLLYVDSKSEILRALRKKPFTNETVKKPQIALGLLSFLGLV